MANLFAAIDALIKCATASGSMDDLQKAIGGVHDVLESASPEERNESLRRLNAALPKMHPFPACKAAMTCGAIVEFGGDPQITGLGLFPLLLNTLAGAAKFLQLCEDKARADGLLKDGDDDDAPSSDELFQKYIRTIYQENPAAAFAAMGEQDISLAVIAHLSRSKQLRAEARRIPKLLQQSLAYDRACRAGHRFLTKMLLVLDDEPMLVLDTDQNKGFKITFSGIPDNFTLHTCLMGTLIGDPREGWIEAIDFDLESVRRAMGHICGDNAPSLTGAFNLWNWTGLQPDGTLPAEQFENTHWIWNEGVPADIAPFDGMRVVILGPPPYERHWRGGLLFSGLVPELTITEKLPESAVKEWLQKLAAAAQANES